RLLAAISGDWTIRTDELFQYLEQAHRLVFGYGQIPWEYRFGERTWILPALSAVPLYLAKVIGWDTPDLYAPLVRSFHALLSMTIPAGMYFFTRRIHSESAARAALVFGCFWHELVVASPHPIAENAAMAVMFAALLITKPQAGMLPRAIVGFLLAMVVVFRLQYAPAVGIIGLLLLWRPPLRANVAMIFAGLAAVFFAGVVDYFAWGEMWHTYINYFKLQFSGYTQFTSNPPPTIHLQRLFITSGGLFYVIILASMFYIRRLWLPAALFLAVQIPHNIFVGEYTNILLGVPFILMLAGCLAAEWLDRPAKKQKRGDDDLTIMTPRQKAAWLSAALLFVSTLAYGGYLPGQTVMYVFKNERPLFHESAFFAVNKALSRMPPEEVKSVVFLMPGGSAHLFGGYYYTHQNTPMWFPFTEDYDRDALGLTAEEMQDVQTLLSTAGDGFATKASHLIMPHGVQVEGFTSVYESAPIAIMNGAQLVIWQNNNPDGVQTPDGAVYDIMDNAIVQVLGLLDTRLSVISQKENPLTPLAP
ncbi:MAG: hypothetical protein ACR2P4_08670, partial [Gammaproteobacteria bacterium]